MSDKKDYLGMFVAKEEEERLDYGIKGMKWGQRRSRAQLAAAKKGGTEKPDGPESSSQKYSRLLAKSKKEGANSLSDEELRFVTQRGDAIRKVNQLNEKKPGWLADATKTALKNAAKREMQNITSNVAKKYISDELFPQSGR